MRTVLSIAYRVALPSFTPPVLWMYNGKLGIVSNVAIGIGVRLLLGLVFVVAGQEVLKR